MSERDRLLTAGTRDTPAVSAYHQVVRLKARSEATVTKYWARAVSIIRAREFFAEFLATFVLMMFGDGSIAQEVLSGEVKNGYTLPINIGWAVGIIGGGYCAIGITGAHMNPAVTLAMALRGRTSWFKVIPYWIAQFLGAFVASAVVYGVYIDALYGFDGAGDENCFDAHGNLTVFTPLCTGRIWATYPQPFLSLANGFLDQVIGTFLLVLGIFAICDSSNSEPQGGVKPLLIAFVLWGVGLSFGFNCGYAVNPARDFAPRAFTAIAEWGADVFVCSNCSIRHWWWVPLVAPMIGGALAAFVYWFLIDAHHPRSPKTDEEEYLPSNVQEHKSRF